MEKKKEIQINFFSSNDSKLGMSHRKGRDCFICFKYIDDTDYKNHVHACAARLDQQTKEFSNSKCFLW